MSNIMFIADLRHRTSKSDSAPAKPEFLGTFRLRESVGRIWHTVVGLLRALDRRMTENLDYRARHMLHGDADPAEGKRRRK